MNNAFNINTLVMFLVSLFFTYATASLLASSEGGSTYGIGFMLDRSMSSVLAPFVIVGLPLAFIRHGKK
jgi:hypothetical protein